MAIFGGTVISLATGRLILVARDFSPKVHIVMRGMTPQNVEKFLMETLESKIKIYLFCFSGIFGHMLVPLFWKISKFRPSSTFAFELHGRKWMITQ